MCLTRKAHVPRLRNNLSRYPFLQKERKGSLSENKKRRSEENQSQPCVECTGEDERGV